MWQDDMLMKKLLLILLLSCAGCSAVDTIPQAAAPAAASSSAPVPDEDAASLLVRIRNTIGSASCTSSVECKTVGVGARACGGPEGYLAYSTSETPPASLEALAARHAERRRAAVSASGMISTCNVLPDPGAVCDKGSCRVGSDFN
jgi:hypothetical protein